MSTEEVPFINSKEVKEISSQKIKVVTYVTEVRNKPMFLKSNIKLSWNLFWVYQDHVAVLTQMHGSVWPRVMPYCICNVLLASTIYYLKFHRNLDLTFSDKGHSFMSLLVSFLVVTRSNIAYSRFMEARWDFALILLRK